jgi:hypothetical protein
VGILTLDVCGYGVVMSADSQLVECLEGENRVLVDPTRQTTRNPIVIRTAGGFTGLTGYVGTEEIGNARTGDWLMRFGDEHPTDDLATYANRLASALTAEWTRLGLRSVLEILIGGVESRDVRFWYVRNSRGLNDGDLTFKRPSTEFLAVDDLDANYVPRDLKMGQTKEDLLKTQMYFFRQGVLLPAVHVFDAFSGIVAAIYAHGIPGFEPIASLDDLGYFARLRMELMKRLFSAKHGLYKESPAPIGGEVHVLGANVAGEIREYPKIRSQTKTLFAPP